MKYHYLLIGLLSAIAVSCSVDEIAAPEEGDGSPAKVFHATIEDQPGGVGTRTFADEQLRVLWNNDDRITIFDNVPVGVEYKFIDQDGDAGGDFAPVGGSGFSGSGGNLGGNIYAIYPHQEDTKISYDGEITFNLSGEQTYHEKSFGRGANTMVAKTQNTLLKFKNTGGYLSFRLYGDDVSVSAIYLEAKGGEPLAGKCKIVVDSEGLPVVTMDDTEFTSIIKLDCGDVTLGTTSAESTEFWFVLPPVEFLKSNGGFTITVTTTDGGVFSRTAKRDLTIERNTIYRMDPLKVVPTPAPDDLIINEIYTTRATAKQENYKYTADYSESDETYTITIPTLTDFDKVVLNYSIKEGDILMCDGEEIESGVTPVDASGEDGATLVLRRGILEKQFTLKAKNTGLPVVKITTTGFTRADVESDATHETIWRPTDTDDPSTGSATVSIFNSDGTLDCETVTQIKGRGNATWSYPKRPYALKFPKKKAVLKMADHKRWILLANWKDRTLLRNDAAFWLSKQVSDVIQSKSFPYTVKGQFVELEFNGEHRGNYYLCEQIKINKKRVNITEMDPQETDPFKVTGGYLIEIDNNWDDENSFNTDVPFGTYGWPSKDFYFGYQFKQPDEGERSSAAYDYMTEHIAKVERLIKGIPNADPSDPEYVDYKDYIDIESAIWFMFINELTSNGDFYNDNSSIEYKGPHSTYLYKDRDTLNADGTTTVSKIHMGPVWDFDYLTFIPSRSNKWAGVKNGNTYNEYYYKYFLSDPVFCNLMLKLWDDYKSYFSGLPAYIDEMAGKIRLSDEFDAEMWWNTSQYGNKDQNQNGELNMDFDQAVANIKSGFSGKWTFMDNNLSKLPRVSLQ